MVGGTAGGTGRSAPVLAGLADTAFASLASFAVGLAATRLLPAAELGAYAIFFSAFVLVTTLPTNLVLVPIEVWLLDVPRAERLAHTRANLRWAAVAAAVSVVPLAATSLAVTGDAVPGSTLVALTFTAAGAGLVSPLQDHVRRLFHLAGRGSLAAVTSAAQMVVVTAALFGLAAAGAGDAWVPLGALAIANVASLALAVVLAGGGPVAARPGLRPIMSSGRWLFVQGVVPIGAGFAANAIVGSLASLVAVGRAEAARIVAQPLFVLGGGLGASLGPRSMEAGADAATDRVRSLRRTYWLVLLPLGAAYIGYAGWNAPWNLLRSLVPVAYETTGLVALAGLAALLVGAGLPMRSELLGMRREKGLTVIDTAAAVARVGVSAAAAVPIAEFSIPAGATADGAYKLVARRRLADRSLADLDATRG